MLQIENVLVSFDLLEKKFCCDLKVCRGACCIEGDYGAPLEKTEIDEIRRNFEGIRIYMTPAGVQAIEKQGFAVKDREGDRTTPLVEGRECAYAIQENGVCWCAIEKAWVQKKSEIRKPASCHLYPLRITRYPAFEAVNYHKWNICRAAIEKGEKEGIPLYRFLKEPLIARYGQEWYEQLEYAAQEYEAGRLIV